MRVHSPAVQHFGNVHGGMPRVVKPHEGVPVVASLRRAIRINSELKRKVPANRAEVSDVTRVDEKYGIPIGLQVGQKGSVTPSFVLVGVEKGRQIVFPDMPIQDLQAIWIEIVVGVHRKNVSAACLFQTEAHATDNPEILFESKVSDPRMLSDFSQIANHIASLTAIVQQNPLESGPSALPQQAFDQRFPIDNRTVPNRGDEMEYVSL